MVRHAVIECLAARHPAALTVPGILRRVRVELDFSLDEREVDGALALLFDKGLVTFETDHLGGSKYWRATAEGVLYVERGQVPSRPQHRVD